MKKKILAMLLSVALLAGAIPVTASAASVEQFSDVKARDWFYDAVEYAAPNGLFHGTGENHLQPGTVHDPRHVRHCVGAEIQRGAKPVYGAAIRGREGRAVLCPPTSIGPPATESSMVRERGIQPGRPHHPGADRKKYCTAMPRKRETIPPSVQTASTNSSTKAMRPIMLSKAWNGRPPI